MRYEEKKLKNLDKFINQDFCLDTYFKNIEQNRVVILRENRGSARLDFVKCVRDPEECPEYLIEQLKEKQEQIMAAFKMEHKIAQIKKEV